MKAFYLWLLATTLVLANTTEDLHRVSGKVTDKATNGPVPFASVVIKNGETIVTGGITDEKGEYTLTKIKSGNYTLEVQFIGYKTYVQKLPITKNLQLPNIILEEEATSLKEVEVVAERSNIVQKIDRKVVNVGQDLINAGPTASDILNNIPSVSVDPQNNTVALRGNPNVRIFIDGKPSNMSAAEVLQSIPSTAIKQIELITNPSAKYNPEGMSGIINIILHKNAIKGFNGSINTGVNFGITPKTNNSFDVNYRIQKFNFYSNYSINYGINNNFGFLKTEAINNPDNSNRNDFYIDNYNRRHFNKTGVDFYANDKNTFSFYTIQSFNSGNTLFDTEIRYDNPVNPFTRQRLDGVVRGHNQIYNLGYKRTFDKPEQTLEIEVNYNNNDNPEDTRFKDTNNQLIATNLVGRNYNQWLVNVDFVTPLSETSKLEAGLESRNDQTINDFNVNQNYVSDFDYRRNIYSGYTNYSKQLGKWSYQLGLRLESYEAVANFRRINETPADFKDYIFTVYPSGFLTYESSEKNSFQWSYSRRVDRPNIQQVNPIREWSSPLLDQEGNPNLVPQFTNSIEMNYTRKTKIGSVTTGAFFRYIQDPISQVFVQSPYDPNKKLMTFANFDNNTEYGIEVSGNLNVKKWWSINFGADAYFRNVRGVVEDLNGDLVQKEALSVPFNGRMNHTFSAAKNHKIILFGMYRGPVDDIQFNSRDMWRLDIGTRHTILKGQGTLSLRMNDIFNTMRARFYGSNPDNVDGQFRWESRMFNVNFNYRFGTGKYRAMQRRQRDANESQGGGMF
ncbi:MAG: TonB-dependent receptor domain-containing protein [Flavobacterium sp.]